MVSALCDESKIAALDQNVVGATNLKQQQQAMATPESTASTERSFVVHARGRPVNARGRWRHFRAITIIATSPPVHPSTHE